MKIQHLIQLVLLLGAGSAGAMPVVNLNQVLSDDQNVNCHRNSQDQDFRGLIVNASYMGQDDRKLLSENMAAVGLTAAEREQAMICTGHIYCPGAGPNGMGSLVSAGSICPPGKRTGRGNCTADRLATSGHMFVNQTTNRFISQLDKCEFSNYRGHRTKLIISDLKSIDPSDALSNPRLNIRADKLVIRMKNPIRGCDPYDLDESPTTRPEGTKLVALTHVQEDQDQSKFDGREPLAYNCEIRKSFAPGKTSAGYFFSDCDLNGGGSGGFALVRNSDNRLAVTGLFATAGFESKNGLPYNDTKETGNENNGVRNLTEAVGTTADFVQIAINPGKKPDYRSAYTDSPSQRPTQR